MGGYYEGIEYEGCSNQTPPIERGWMYIPYRLYFAKKSKRWDNMRVAFISCTKETNSDYHAVVRLREITEQQFNEIWEKESKSWYHKKILLGEKERKEIVTITGCWEKEINLPSEKYLNVIKKGLKETTGWDEDKIR